MSIAPEQPSPRAAAGPGADREQGPEGNALLQAVLDAGKLGVWEWDVRHNRVTWTERLYEFHGIEPGSFGGTVEDFARLVYPDDLPALQGALEQALARQAPYELDFRVVRPGGEIRWLSTSAQVTTDGEGAPVRMIGITQDITERSRTQAALRESEERFRQVAEVVPQFIWIIRGDGALEYVNQRWIDYSGLGFAATADPQRLAAVFHPEDRAEMFLRWEEARERGEPFEIEARMQGTGGVYRWFLIRTVQTRDENGNILKWFGTSTDIHERRESEKALREADRRKDEFLAMLAHELRNPLAPIRNAAQVLKMVGSGDAHQQWAREVIERQTQHLTRLVDDLLDVSRITRGKVTIAREPLDLATIVQRAVEASRPLIEARRHELTVALPPGPVRVEGDLTRLVQVVGNLLNNAAKYTDEGGSIRLEAAQESQEAVIRVIDNGMGVPADLLPHVFDLFTQADRSLDRSEGGLGIGLTLVRQLVELHGGRVEARSDGPGQGSEFVVRLPAETALAAPSAKTAAAAPVLPAAQGLKLLVVEDNVDSAEVLSLMLTLVGHQVRTAYSGPEALEAAQTFAPHAVLCDIGLPGMNGYELAARLRDQPAFRQIPLIALTGYGQEEARRRAEEAGFDHHLVKPVEPDALAALLEALAPEP